MTIMFDRGYKTTDSPKFMRTNPFRSRIHKLPMLPRHVLGDFLILRRDELQVDFSRLLAGVGFVERERGARVVFERLRAFDA